MIDNSSDERDEERSVDEVFRVVSASKRGWDESSSALSGL